MLALNHGKHVLVEKAFTVNRAEAEAVRDRAAELGLLVRDAMWTRYFPHMLRSHEILDAGTLGEVRALTADHTQLLPTDPAHRLNDPALGGGALLDLGVYPIAFALGILGAPTGFDVRGRTAFTGVDAHVVIIGEHGEHGGAFSRLATSLDARPTNRATILGEAGRIEVPPMFHETSEFDLVINEERMRWVDPTEVRGPDALAFQAVAAAADIAAGRTESALHPLSTSIAVLEVIDAARAAVGSVSLG